jgi:hypothetical protein
VQRKKKVLQIPRRCSALAGAGASQGAHRRPFCGSNCSETASRSGTRRSMRLPCSHCAWWLWLSRHSSIGLVRIRYQGGFSANGYVRFGSQKRLVHSPRQRSTPEAVLSRYANSAVALQGKCPCAKSCTPTAGYRRRPKFGCADAKAGTTSDRTLGTRYRDAPTNLCQPVDRVCAVRSKVMSGPSAEISMSAAVGLSPSSSSTPSRMRRDYDLCYIKSDDRPDASADSTATGRQLAADRTTPPWKSRSDRHVSQRVHLGS